MVDLALYIWFPIVLLLFAVMPKHRAVVAAIVGGALLLPEIHMAKLSPEAPEARVVAVLKFTKHNVTAFAPLLAAIVFDLRRLLTFRPRWFDLPMGLWCLCPFISNLSMGVGTYDSFAATRDQILVWGVPYFLGRVYFTDPRQFLDLALGLVLGGLLYVPLCLYEVRMFPNLHSSIYGFFPGDQSEVFRFGGYRPVVFMQHGLAVGMWMVAVSLIGWWLWTTRAVTRFTPWPGVRPVSVAWAVVPVLIATLLVRSMGAMVLGLAGALAMYQVRWFKWPALTVVLLIVSPLYILERSWGAWSTDRVVGWLAPYTEQDRLDSFKFRLVNEDVLLEKAWERPLLGFGDTGESRKVKKKKKTDDQEAVTDGQWIITLGSYGFLGLFAQTVLLLLPPIRYLWTYSCRLWSRPDVGPGVAISMVLILYMADCISNAMYQPVFILAAGALASVTGNALIRPPVVPADASTQVQKEEKPTPAAAQPVRPGVLRRVTK